MAPQQSIPQITGSGPKRVTIVEVGPRDGLQNERVRVPTATKVQFIEADVMAFVLIKTATNRRPSADRKAEDRTLLSLSVAFTRR